MNETISTPNQIEKVVEENALLLLLDSKVFIKKGKERIGIDLKHISNVRIVRSRDLTLSILVLVLLALFYVLFLIPLNLNFTVRFLCVILVSILFIISLSSKNYTYTLLINQGKFGFNEILISKKNSVHAERFAAKFKSGATTKMNENKFDYHSLKECV